MTTAVDIAEVVAEAVIKTLIEQVGLDSIVRAVFESDPERIREILRAEYAADDATIEALKVAKFGPRKVPSP